MVEGAGRAYRYCFIAGLHRTGTSLAARTIGSHSDIATITGSGVPEDEGCYLQGAIPHTARHGVPGEYATDPDQHLTERSALNTLETAHRLERDWSRWFDPQSAWRLEKSPVNLTRMRLLQALFPMAHFVVVTRHPLVMAHALRKWSDRPLPDLARYGVRAYEKMMDDLAWLHAAMVVRYEDMVAEPGAFARSVESFLGLDRGIEPPAMRDGNRDYALEETEQGGEADAASAGAMPTLGYGKGGRVEPWEPIVRHPLRSRRELVIQQM